MNLEEYKGVYIFAEQVDNRISGIAFELVGKAKDLAADLPDSFVTSTRIPYLCMIRRFSSSL